MNKEFIDMNQVYYGDSFTFKCIESFTKMGNTSNTEDGNKVQCLDSGFWDLGDLRCIGKEF